jgi:hypothetical protein
LVFFIAAQTNNYNYITKAAAATAQKGKSSKVQHKLTSHLEQHKLESSKNSTTALYSAPDMQTPPNSAMQQLLIKAKKRKAHSQRTRALSLSLSLSLLSTNAQYFKLRFHPKILLQENSKLQDSEIHHQEIQIISFYLTSR